MLILLFFVFLPLLIVGLCDFLHYFRLLLISPKREPQKVMLLHIEDENDLIGALSVFEKVRWHGKYFADKVICIYREDFDLEMFAELRDKGIIFLKEDEQNKRLFQIGDGYGEERAERHGRENYI